MDHDAAISRLVRPVEGRDHIQGSASAVVTLVEYGDYQCERTRAAYSVVRRIQNLSGDWLRFVFRNFPRTDIHERAEIAAEAAEAAAAQGSFWEMHDCLMQRQGLDEGSIVNYAEEIGLDLDRFQIDLGGHAYKQRIQDDVKSGEEAGVKNTPTFFMNGMKYDGELTEEKMLEAIERAAGEIEDDQ
ncbi:MAG: DsbA family protein [Armatimonadota bacterium]